MALALAVYNVACVYSLQGRLEDAAASSGPDAWAAESAPVGACDQDGRGEPRSRERGGPWQRNPIDSRIGMKLHLTVLLALGAIAALLALVLPRDVATLVVYAALAAMAIYGMWAATYEPRQR